MSTPQIIETIYTTKFVKDFGVFVGLFNRTTQANISVKNALQNKDLIALFEMTRNSMDLSIVTGKVQDTSTKKRSYQKTNMGRNRARVYDYVLKNPNSTRKEISNGIGMRIQSVCSAVNPLVNKGLLYVSGEVYDAETDRMVETLVLSE